MPADALPQPVAPRPDERLAVTWGQVATSGLTASRPETSTVTTGGAR